MSAPAVEVWVCARPGAPRLDAALAALRAAGAEPRVAVAEPGAGPAAARNAALAGCEAEVLALVDDDVVVAPGWLEALHAAWSAPGAAGLGCTGGPLGVAFPDGRPPWLGDGLLPALGVDPGPGGGEADVDPARRTFLAGNAAFRAAALRGIGGFWPARGRAGLRDWFGEEHHAQRELARAGWRARWLPDARAARHVGAADVTPRELLGRRARTGARSAVVGERRPAAVAARAALTGAAGVAVAGARRDRALLVERAARVAENAGVLAAPALGLADLQPAAARTPFQHTVPPAQPHGVRAAARAARPRPPRRRGPAPLVLLYHRFAAGREDPLGLAVAPQRLCAQLEVLADRRAPVALEEVVAGDAPPGAVAVTIDDGYADVLHRGLPAFEAAGVPLTVFVSTGHVAEGRAFWWDALARLLRAAPPDAGTLRLQAGGQERAWVAGSPEQRAAAFRWLARWLQFLPPPELDAVLRDVGAWARVEDPLAPPAGDEPLTVDELRRLAASPLVTIGAHTRRHACLAVLDAAARADELAGPRDDLAAWLGRVPTGVAYPYGVPGVDVDEATYAAARAAGYTHALVNAPGPLTARTDRFRLPRHAAPDAGADAFGAWLRAAG